MEGSVIPTTVGCKDAEMDGVVSHGTSSLAQRKMLRGCLTTLDRVVEHTDNTVNNTELRGEGRVVNR